MMQHRNLGGSMLFMPWLWCLTGLENGKQVVKRTGVVGHKSVSDIENSNFKALLTYHFLKKDVLQPYRITNLNYSYGVINESEKN